MATITIIGTGLIGCSFGMTLRNQGHFIVGCDRNDSNLNQAKTIGAVDATCQSLSKAVEKSEAVIIATPVDIIIEILPQILDNLPLKSVVIDTGSTKMAICDAVRNHPRRHAFVATHPMAGSEQSGPLGAHANLFENRRVAICESELSSNYSLKLALEIFTQMKLQPVFLSAKEHDETVALVSHLPQLIAYTYASLPGFTQSNNPSWVELASSGFDSSTRLASSALDVWIPILAQNKEFVVDALRTMSQKIDFMADSICCDDTDSLESIIKSANTTRKKFDLNQKKKEKTESISLIH